MSSLVALLSTLVILITAVGTFRFASRFYGSTLMGILISGAITTSLLIFFNIYLVLLGLMPFILGALLIYKYTKGTGQNDQQERRRDRVHRQRHSPPQRRNAERYAQGQRQTQSQQQATGETQSTAPLKVCENCGQQFRTRRTHCRCGGMLFKNSASHV